MKTFTATQLNKKPQEVFAAVMEDGEARIKHDRYPLEDIILMRRPTKLEHWTPLDPAVVLPQVGDVVEGPDGNQYKCVATTGDNND